MERETRYITYDFVNIIKDRPYAKSLYERAYRHFLLKKADVDYFASTLGNCKYFKLSKKYKKNDIVVLPISYDHDNDEFNTSKDLIIDKLLMPIVSKLMSIVFDKNFEINFYNTFKYKYFIPILEAEYSRMTKEDLDYNNEKPFIICIESAISSFLIDDEYVNSISNKILNKLEKSLKNFKFVPVAISNTGTNLIGDPLKLLDHFSIIGRLTKDEYEKLDSNKQILVDVINTIADPEKDYYINLESSNYDLPAILNYILIMCLIEIIRRHSRLDVSTNVTDDVIENIRNELFIYNSRTAKVIKDYLIKFRANYDYFFALQTKQSSYKLITDMLSDIASDEKDLYKDDTIKTYRSKDPVSTSVAATTKLYTMISTIESMNRDYMKSNNSFIVDINVMHNVFEMISKNMKEIVELRNEFFNLIYMNPDIFLDKWYPEHKPFEVYKMIENCFNNCINEAIKYGKAGEMYKDYVLHHLYEELRCLYFKDVKINTKDMEYILANDKENGFDTSKYTNIVDQLFSIIVKLSSNIINISSLYLENILQDIQHWSATMENNVRYYQFFNSVDEFEKYNNHILVSKEDFDFFTFDFFERT